MSRNLILVILITYTVPLRADEIDEFVAVQMKQQKVPGLSLGVVRDGKVIKAKGYGLANLEHTVPAKRETVYQSGSVGKQFTATAVMMLVEDGKIKLDDPVSKHLPDTPESWKGITVRHLLTHTAGIRNYTGTLDLRMDYTEDELLKKAYGLNLEFPPGEKFKYSNTGYAVLGIMISKVTGKFYGKFLSERIFEPLGMKTARIISEADIVPNRAAGYRVVKNEWKNQEWVSPSANSTADGSLYVTIDDMILWDAALSTEKLLKKASFDQMWTAAKTNDGKSTQYGFGWSLGETKGHKRIYHGGAWQGFTSYIDRYVDDKLTIIVLTNLGSPHGKPGEIAQGVAQLVMPELKGKQ